MMYRHCRQIKKSITGFHHGPNYASGSNMLPCTSVAGNLVQCNINMNIGSNSQQNIVLESTVINLSNPESSQILIGAYDKTNGMKLGENTGSWSQLIIADQEMKKYSSNNATINLGFLLNVNHDGNTTSYSALIADPLLIDRHSRSCSIWMGNICHISRNSLTRQTSQAAG